MKDSVNVAEQINEIREGRIAGGDLVQGTMQMKVAMDTSEVVAQMKALTQDEIHSMLKKMVDDGQLRITNSFASDVVEFNRRVLKIEPRPISTLSQTEYDISTKCLNEEVKEFQEAYEKGDIIGMIDAITDMKYFGDGILYKMGLTANSIDRIGVAVHEANMSKKLGVNVRRGDGSAADAVKPEGWTPPEERIAKILDEQSSVG